MTLCDDRKFPGFQTPESGEAFAQAPFFVVEWVVHFQSAHTLTPKHAAHDGNVTFVNLSTGKHLAERGS